LLTGKTAGKGPLMSPVPCFVYPHGRYIDRKGKVLLGKHQFLSFSFGVLCGKVVVWIYNKMVDFRTREFLQVLIVFGSKIELPEPGISMNEGETFS
jgi:hypothetical protein